MTEQTRTTLGFIGGGNMSASIVGGLVRAGWSADQIMVSDPVQEQLDRLSESHGVRVTTDNTEVLSFAEVVVLAIKPQVMASVLKPLGDALDGREPLLVSIAAGIPARAIVDWLGHALPLVRVMPNTPALISKGISGLFASGDVNPEQRALAESVMSSVGETVWVDEEQLIDAVTGVSGSGPAYFFKLMELMIEEGIAQGLDPEAARKLVVHTGIGAAMLLGDSDLSAAELRRQVTSPNGTTQAGIEAMEAGGIDKTVRATVRAAADRAAELSLELTQKTN